jgi:predicted  nucleic acid-binding Zn-ribbon protein
MVADLQALLAVQDLDLAIDRETHRRQSLPERTQIAAIDERAKKLLASLKEAQAARDEVSEREAATEAELKGAEERAKVVEKRLYSGEVSASRELQAMAAEVEHLRDHASRLEEAALGLLEEREPYDDRVAALESELEELGRARSAAAAALAAGEAEIDRELANLRAQRDHAAASLPPDLLGSYERLRVRLDGVGAARLVGDHCDGCHLKLPATELDRIRHLPPQEMVNCDQCGRILVRS